MKTNERASNGLARLAIVVFGVMCLPVVTAAQVTSSGFIGVARDASGGVLPGVTVEATSPALIEGTRVAVTDGSGAYRIVGLSPGTYSVTFTLPGFGTFVRDGIELTASFTATVNGVLTVGGIAETVTVTGEAPLVDMQNVSARATFRRDRIEALPISKTTGVWNSLIPALRTPVSGTATGGLDVGGTQSERTQANVTVHGGTDDIRIVQDGMEAMRGVYSMNRVSTAEVAIQLGGNPAEAETGGVRINIIPREGSNIFGGTFEVDGTWEALQGSNSDDALRARGLVGTPGVDRVYNIGAGVGGPIVQDRLWFFGSYRKWGTAQNLPGKFYNATQGGLYTADLSRPATSNDYYGSASARLTWAATSRQKFVFSYEQQNNCNCLIRLVAQDRAPEAVGNHKYFVKVPQGQWQYVASNRLLIDAGLAYYNGQGSSEPVDGVRPTDIAWRDLGTGFRWGARADALNGSGAYADRSMRRNLTERVNVSYVTGAHNFKRGGVLQHWPNFQEYRVNGDAQYRMRNGVPHSVVLHAGPLRQEFRSLSTGLFVQDQWTLNRLTLNLGVRYDRYSGHAPETKMGAGTYVPARTFAKTDTLTALNDLNVRAGFAYDISGTGRTAIKGFLGRFILGQKGTVPGVPSTQTVRSATRSWRDANGDFVPQENELGPLSNSNFGTQVPSNLTVDRDVSFGFGNRPYTWQGIVSIDHEIVPGLGVQVAYYRTSHGSINYLHDTALAPNDFYAYSVMAPVDSRLPGNVSGSLISGLFDVNPDARGRSNIVQSVARDGEITRVFNGVDVNLTGRFFNRATLNGGIAVGNETTNYCAVQGGASTVTVVGFDAGWETDLSASPRDARFCNTTFGWRDNIQFKLNGTIALPWSLQTAFVFQSVSGFPVAGTMVVDRASNGQRFSGNDSHEIFMFDPNSEFEKRTQMLDLRFSKRFAVEGTTFTGNLDIANILNSNNIQNVVTIYGSRYLNATNALSARLVRLGLQIGF